MEAQCYLQKTEASGFNTAQFQTSLNQAACAMKDSLPTEFQAQFKVITFGLYTLAPTFNSGIAPMLAKAKQDAENESPYYLLIVRESNSTGLFTKFHIELKLPNTSTLSCVDSTKQQIIEQTILQTMNAKYGEYDQSPSFYAQAEIAGMEILGKILGAVKSGNCCIPSDEAVENWLLSEGFVKLRIEGSNSNNPKVIGPISAKPDPTQQRNNDFVTDFANLFVEINGQSVNLENGINEVLLSNNYAPSNPKFFILKNQSICNGEYEIALNQISENMPNLGGIIYIQNKFYGPDNLYLKVMGMTIAGIISIFCEFIYLSYATNMTFILSKRGIEPIGDRTLGFFDAEEAGAEREHVGIIVLATQRRNLTLTSVKYDGANALCAISDHRLALSRLAEDDRLTVFAFGDIRRKLLYRTSDEDRIVVGWILLERAAINRLVPHVVNELGDHFLEGKAGVIGSQVDLHICLAAAST
jgi:hypothetical protein